MMALIKNCYVHFRLFWIVGAIILFFILAFPLPWLLPVAKTLVVIFVAVILLDGILLFNRNVRLSCTRQLPKLMSLGSENRVRLVVQNRSALKLEIQMINEWPYQLQKRDKQEVFTLEAGEAFTFHDHLRPVSRGEYQFGLVHLYVSSVISLLQRRMTYPLDTMVPVYPSVLDLKKYELHTSTRLTSYMGIKKIRRIGQSYEFEQISEYSQGDNYQHMNWKATGKVGRLMVNRYTDEKSQPIYCLIDKSRYMRMPFDGMTLLDYAINASLIISNGALRREDKAGLLTFSDRVETLIKADNKRNQLNHILQTLYRESETRLEANYELMYTYMRKHISGRGLFFLFSNFDTIFALERVLPILRKINSLHLLVVVVFENTELERFNEEKANTVLDIYYQTINRKLIQEKRLVLNQLQQHAIQVIYSKPEELSLNTLNKYLELKSRGMV